MMKIRHCMWSCDSATSDSAFRNSQVQLLINLNKVVCVSWMKHKNVSRLEAILFIKCLLKVIHACWNMIFRIDVIIFNPQYETCIYLASWSMSRRQLGSCGYNNIVPCAWSQRN